MIAKYFGSVPSGESLNAYRDLISLPASDVAKKYNVSENKLVKALAKSPAHVVLDLLFKHVSSTPIPVFQPRVW
jgi:hypothetical protein